MVGRTTGTPKKTLTDDLDRLDRLFDSRNLRVGNLNDLEQPNLYHYTRAVGLRGILTDQVLWATNFSFLNDKSEVQHGRKLVLGILGKEKREQAQDARTKRLLRAIKKSFEEQALSEVYVCCFTEHCDDLSQWRAYGTATEARYCIGFDLGKIEKWALCVRKHSPTRPLDFEKVIYDQKEQSDNLQKVINFATASGENLGIATIATWAARRLARLLPQLKSPEYRVEKEWRLIQRVPPDDVKTVCFAAERGILRPYVTLKPPVKLPVVELLVLAPGREEASLKAADMLLLQAGMEGVKSELSKVPFAE
jgi:hypothetical protein